MSRGYWVEGPHGEPFWQDTSFLDNCKDCGYEDTLIRFKDGLCWKCHLKRWVDAGNREEDWVNWT